jgi:hypothetical protein
VRDVKLDPRDPRVVYVTAFNNAVHRSAPSLENGEPRSSRCSRSSAAHCSAISRCSTWRCRTGGCGSYAYNAPRRVAPQALYRLDNADVRRRRWLTGSGQPGEHVGVAEDVVETISATRARSAAGCAVAVLLRSRRRHATGQPDTVIIGGVASLYGDATIRSTDGGETFHRSATIARDPRNSSHVDRARSRSIRRTRASPSSDSDGGRGRTTAILEHSAAAAISCSTTRRRRAAPCCARCRRASTSSIKGLQTLQFYNIALDPAAPLTRNDRRAQDNSTIWLDGLGHRQRPVWKACFPAAMDIASGFHPTRSNVTFASFQSNRFFTNFRNGDVFAVGAHRRSDPSPPRAGDDHELDRPPVPGVRSGQPRTRSSPAFSTSGGRRTTAARRRSSKRAAISVAVAADRVGDWVPLGVAFPFPAGSTAGLASRFPAT